uniref:Uncharacterized protein n=1 Tax=Anguilla anguilla TaxID=7936 RepID=A0A0E9SKN8_ANGAN
MIHYFLFFFFPDCNVRSAWFRAQAMHYGRLWFW